MALARKWFAFVPNLLTSFNLACGSLAIYFVVIGQIKLAVFLMLAAAAFDFFDGFAARLLHVSGPMGKELDSLADVVSFGLLPGFLVLHLQSHFLFQTTIAQMNPSSTFEILICLSALIIPILSAIRLAKFNIDTRQSDRFIGLPTPANALFFASLVWSFYYEPPMAGNQNILIIALLVLSVVFSLLLVSEIPLIALKFKTFDIKTNRFRYALILFAVLSIVFAGISGIWMTIIFYILLSTFQHVVEKK
jgi:CDP-diacylglycerol---serine O-phosphatidyltransferase